jgi:putative acetyltransferase
VTNERSPESVHVPPQPAPRAAPHGLLLRAASPADAEAILEMINLPGFRRGTLRLPFHSLEEVRQRLDAKPDTVTRIVAVLDGKVVGEAGLYRHSGRKAHSAAVAIGIHDDFAGRGIGTALLGALVDLADNWLGLARLELSVFVDNAPALALYKRFGFEIEGTRRADAFRDGAFVDSYEMARLVPERLMTAGER